MKLHNETAEAEVYGDSGRSAFQIKASAKAFSILSSGLYSDKILAIVRELSTNAYDSHVEAGNPNQPFSVHLPNSLDPTFSVQDYGIGLDDEEIRGRPHQSTDEDGNPVGPVQYVGGIYNTYFESTKQDSDDYVGALGLGSKSPFSYTDNFLITAVKGGVKRVYTAMIEDGFPTVVKFGKDQRTNEPNGVRVEFAVQKNDFMKFAEAAKKVYRWFDVQPTIRGNKIQVEPCQMVHENIVPGASIRDTEQNGFRWNDNTPYARQGTVAYPINPNEGDIDEDLRYMLKIPLVIDFPIGSLDVTPSRESLSYIKHTNDNINKRLREIADGLEEYVKRELVNATTDWDRALVVDKMFKTTALRSITKHVLETSTSLFDIAEVTIMHNSVTVVVRDEVQRKHGFSVNQYMVKSVVGNNDRVRLSKCSPYYDVIKGVDGKPVFNADGTPKNKYFYLVPPGGNIRIFVNDTKRKNVLSRVRNVLPASNARYAFVIDIDNDKALKKAKETFGQAPFEYISDLPEVKNLRPASVTTGTKISLFAFVHGAARTHNNMLSWGWEERKSSIAAIVKNNAPYKVLYVPLNNRTVLYKRSTLPADEFRAFVSDLVKVGIIEKTTEIIGVRKSVIDKLTNDYINLFDYVKSELKKVDEKQLAEAAKLRYVNSATKNNFSVDVSNRVEGRLNKNHPIAELLRTSKAVLDLKGLKNPANINIIRSISKQVDYELMSNYEFRKIESAAKAEWASCISKYPMIGCIDNCLNVDVSVIIDYINLVDRCG